ncbi:hypothetical protein CDAR_70411 [Caerostris darwini]|uniref:Uncharacterized protein n=1 Tax=Caerostris darwini TaxID=1538125 RepID=A0AAV4PHW8_9ARAC|nr:hypothetical protein CDAR_70411 [Caerostris darwini]
MHVDCSSLVDVGLAVCKCIDIYRTSVGLYKTLDPVELAGCLVKRIHTIHQFKRTSLHNDSFQYCPQTTHVSGIALSHPMQGSGLNLPYDSTVGARGSSPRVFVRKTSLSGDYYPPVPHTILKKDGGDTAL